MKHAARKANTRTFLAVALLGAMAIPAAAREDGCTGFSFPVDAEMAWMKAPPSETIETGAKVPGMPAKALALKLKLTREVTLPVKPGRKALAIGKATYSGWFEIANLPKGGLYQITLSHEAWIDAVQNGELIHSHSFVGKPACKIVRKSVRYKLGAGPLTVQFSGAEVEALKVAIREAN
jgi:hypothetical protein